MQSRYVGPRIKLTDMPHIEPKATPKAKRASFHIITIVIEWQIGPKGFVVGCKLPGGDLCNGAKAAAPCRQVKGNSEMNRIF